MGIQGTGVVSALVVEDEPDYAGLIAEVLEDDGFTVTKASDGVEALERVRALRPDVITLDIQMPQKGGVMFYRELKSDPEFGEIPVVVVTGVTKDDADMKNFVRTFLEVEHLPMPEAYLEKPIDNDELLRVVNDALRSDPGLASTSPQASSVSGESWSPAVHVSNRTPRRSAAS